MKVLFHVGYPLAWAPGGHAMQIRSSQRALEQLGVDITWLHNEAENLPNADIVHYWSEPGELQLLTAKGKGCKTVLSTMRTTRRQASAIEMQLRRLTVQGLSTLLSSQFRGATLKRLDALIVLNELERDYFSTVWGVPRNRIHVVPNGVDDVFFDEQSEPIPFDGLVCVGYISETKNSVELAQAAWETGIPIKFIGGVRTDSYTPADYGERFKRLIDDRFVVYIGELTDKREIARHLRGCKGLVMPSRYEAQGIVALEALACNLPVMMTKLPSLKAFYGDAVSYCEAPQSRAFAQQLKDFYNNAQHNCESTFKVHTWHDVAMRIFRVYEQVIAEE